MPAVLSSFELRHFLTSFGFVIPRRVRRVYNRRMEVLHPPMQRSEIIAWLRESNEARLEELWRRADLVRQQSVGGEVHLRGLIEISNHCIRLCGYCGLRFDNRELPRYRMTADEILDCVQEGVAFGYGTAVLQAGEDPGIEANWMADVIRRIKALSLSGESGPMAVTLSLGEREYD